MPARRSQRVYCSAKKKGKKVSFADEDKIIPLETPPLETPAYQLTCEEETRSRLRRRPKADIVRPTKKRVPSTRRTGRKHMNDASPTSSEGSLERPTRSRGRPMKSPTSDDRTVFDTKGKRRGVLKKRAASAPAKCAKPTKKTRISDDQPNVDMKKATSKKGGSRLKSSNRVRSVSSEDQDESPVTKSEPSKHDDKMAKFNFVKSSSGESVECRFTISKELLLDGKNDESLVEKISPTASVSSYASNTSTISRKSNNSGQKKKVAKNTEKKLTTVVSAELDKCHGETSDVHNDSAVGSTLARPTKSKRRPRPPDEEVLEVLSLKESDDLSENLRRCRRDSNGTDQTDFTTISVKVPRRYLDAKLQKMSNSKKRKENPDQAKDGRVSRQMRSPRDIPHADKSRITNWVQNTVNTACASDLDTDEDEIGNSVTDMDECYNTKSGGSKKSCNNVASAKYIPTTPKKASQHYGARKANIDAGEPEGSEKSFDSISTDMDLDGLAVDDVHNYKFEGKSAKTIPSKTRKGATGKVREFVKASAKDTGDSSHRKRGKKDGNHRAGKGQIDPPSYSELGMESGAIGDPEHDTTPGREPAAKNKNAPSEDRHQAADEKREKDSKTEPGRKGNNHAALQIQKASPARESDASDDQYDSDRLGQSVPKGYTREGKQKEKEQDLRQEPHGNDDRHLLELETIESSASDQSSGKDRTETCAEGHHSSKKRNDAMRNDVLPGDRRKEEPQDRGRMEDRRGHRRSLEDRRWDDRSQEDRQGGDRSQEDHRRDGRSQEDQRGGRRSLEDRRGGGRSHEHHDSHRHQRKDYSYDDEVQHRVNPDIHNRDPVDDDAWCQIM